MSRVVTVEHYARRRAALRRRMVRRGWDARALATTSLLLLATLLATVTGWPETVFASDRSVDSTATAEVETWHEPEATASSDPPAEPTEELPVEEVTAAPTSSPAPPEPPLPSPEPTPEPVPHPTFIATTNCPVANASTGLLHLEVAEAPATVTDVLAVVAPETTASVRLDVLLPATLVSGVAVWQWWLEDPQSAQPVALLVRVAELSRDDVANTAAGDGRDGWLLAPVTPPVEGCPLPDAPIDPTPDPTPQDGGGNPIGFETDPVDEPAAEPTPEAVVTETIPAPPIVEETETPVAALTETAMVEPAASPEAGGSAVPPATADPDPIELTILSEDGEALPGKSARYRFRITNTANAPLTIRLTTTDSLDGWASTVYNADGTTPLTEVHLGPGESVDVIVRVIPPVGAHPGDQNVTAFDARAVKTTA